ncbi:hypothetical protein K2173_023254 [Erythroxylum novogranatense]|uniref:F-box domain-containing protein n=1 Tax=Erythroxylum novogranatense TaxID=1862640 RepID=A0AAV8TAS5_9ROSI|nr:hypothetical protein K2173_023254 [Erythroxylum novogranatense]
MSDYLPPEVLVEIFLRLPVDSLLRFRCVCKSWHCLITDPTFVSLYTQFAATNNHKKANRFIIRRYSKVQGKETFTLNFDDDGSLVATHQLNWPFKSSLDYFQIVGSCNGLLCLTDYHSKQRGCPQSIILWNPLVRKFANVPLKHNIDSRCFDAILGFGFDSKSINYKVVKVVYFVADYPSQVVWREVEIFDLRLGAWRNSKATVTTYPDFVIDRSSQQAFLNETIHWVGCTLPNKELGGQQKLVVATFDVSNEVFGQLEIPEETANLGYRNKMSLSVLGGSLSLIWYKNVWPEQHSSICYIWVMKDYGVSESWLKQYKIHLTCGVSKALGLRGNGEILLVMSHGLLVSYDPESNRISPLDICGDPYSFFLDTYVDSLFLWKGLHKVRPEVLL